MISSVSGHDFSRAEEYGHKPGFSRCPQPPGSRPIGAIAPKPANPHLCFQ
jgi:hypothetical protein